MGANLTSRKNALLIVEGESAEPRLLGKPNGNVGLLPFMGISDYEMHIFRTTVYELYEEYIRGNYDDIVSYLVTKGLELPPGESSRTAFSAIYLIFDFEPHYQKYSDDSIREMCALFDNETELGKLYINYPMIEACRHLKELPDNDFMDRTIEVGQDFNGKSYKRIVNIESCIGHYTKKNIAHILAANYNKAKSLDSTRSLDVDYQAILELQIDKKNSENLIYELGTAPLMAIDYNMDLVLEKYSMTLRKQGNVMTLEAQ